jgi:hypothetical protein
MARDDITTIPQASDSFSLADMKGSADHLEHTLTIDKGVIHLQAEAEWIRSLSEEEYALESKKLVRKVRKYVR